MKAKRIISILLVLVIAGAFTGCRKNPRVVYSSYYDSDDGTGWYEDDNTDGENGESQSGSDASGGNSGGSGGSTVSGGTNSGTTNLEGNTYLSGFPIVKNKETIKIMAVTRSSDIGDTNKSQFTKTYSQMTNMDITFVLAEENAISQRKTLALQSGNLPDIFTSSCNLTDQDVQQYSSEGTLIEITKDMLKKWAPNVYKFYDDYDLWDFVKATDGKMYSIAGGTMDYLYDQHYLWINKTWLNKVGLSMPKTMNDFYNVLKAFKTKDPNGNGANDEIPYATWSSGGFFTQPWGVNPGIFVAPNGKITYGTATTNMKNCATFWSKVYKEGLVDKNSIDNWAGDNAAFKTLIKSGKVGAFFWGWPTELSEDLLKQYEICPWPTSGDDNGDYYDVYTNVMNNFFPDAFFITKACKNVPAALRFIDYFYTNDGYMLTYQGTPGYLYTKVSDTLYKTTGKTQASTDILGPQWTMPGRYFLVNATYQTTGSTYIADQRKAADKVMADRIKQYGQKTMSNAYKNKTEIKSINQYATYFDGNTTAYFDYVKGNKSLSSDWTAMVNELSKKGLSKYISAWQTYYDRVSK